MSAFLKRRNRVNLDELFGFVYNNMIGEPLRPYKVAVFYLLRNLFRMHFGYKTVPSPRPFVNVEHTRILILFYGLTSSERDVTYEEVLKVVRFMDIHIRRGIYYDFVYCMERLAYGEHISMQVDDTIFHGRREFADTALYETPLPKPLQFLTAKSYLGIWLKRAIAQWNRATQAQQFEYSINMHKWLNEYSGNVEISFDNFLRPSFKMPIPIESSFKARRWISQQMHLLQVCPSSAIFTSEKLEWISMIKDRHPDVDSVYLLEMMLAIQSYNQVAAVEALKIFFDFTALKFNENLVDATQSHRLAVPSHYQLRFGPLLHGKLCRIFGERRMAAHLLAESIQQAQLSSDSVCNRMANVEVTAVEVLGNDPLLNFAPPIAEENQTEEEAEQVDRRMMQSNLDKGHEEEAEPENMPDDAGETLELYRNVLASAKLLSVVSDMAKCRPTSSTIEMMQLPLRACTTTDKGSKARIVENTAIAIASSNCLRNGLFKVAEEISEYMLNSNVSDGAAPCHETESQAVAGVNCAYALASRGEHSLALDVTKRLEKRFSSDINWQAAQHVRICKLLIEFEQNLLNDDAVNCEFSLQELAPIVPTEALLRKALLMGLKGETRKGLNLLQKYSGRDPMVLARIQMQTANLYILEQRFDAATRLLDEAAKSSAAMSHRNVYAMVLRRKATISMSQRNYEEALVQLFDIEMDIESLGGIVERILFAFAVGCCLRRLKEDPLYYFSIVRRLSIKCGWKAMEKLALAECGGYFSDVNDLEKRSAVGEAFCQLDDLYPGKLEWVVI